MAVETQTREVVEAVKLTSVSCGLRSDGEWVWFDSDTAGETTDKIAYSTFKNVIETLDDKDEGMFDHCGWTIKKLRNEFSIDSKHARRVVCYEYSTETDGLKEFFEVVDEQFDV